MRNIWVAVVDLKNRLTTVHADASCHPRATLNSSWPSDDYPKNQKAYVRATVISDCFIRKTPLVFYVDDIIAM